MSDGDAENGVVDQGTPILESSERPDPGGPSVQFRPPEVPPVPYIRKTCSGPFRDFVFERFPGLALDPGHVRLMQLVLFSTKQRDSKTGEPILCAATVAACYGRSKQQAQHNYSAEADIERFQQDVLPGLSVRPYSAKDKRCRTIRYEGLPPDVEAALRLEMGTPVRDRKPRVYFDTGRVFTRTIQRDERRALEAHAAQESARSLFEGQCRLLQYMNGRPPDTFTRMLSHIPEAIRAAGAIKNDHARLVELRKLRSVEDMPRPLYAPSAAERTARVFEIGEGLASLRKDIRRVVMQGTDEYDLRSSQLAINARLWGVPDVMAFLESRESIWTSLMGHLGLGWAQDDAAAYADVKGALKTALYALLYGANQYTIAKGEQDDNGRYLAPGLNERLGVYGVSYPTTRFLSHPVIGSMFEARERRLRELREAGEATDCFGTRFEVTSRKDAKSALSRIAQAVEMRLLLPVLDLAESTDDFSIVLWQHDGFSVRYHREDKRDRWHRRITEAVNSMASERGYPTVLEVERL